MGTTEFPSLFLYSDSSHHSSLHSLILPIDHLGMTTPYIDSFSLFYWETLGQFSHSLVVSFDSCLNFTITRCLLRKLTHRLSIHLHTGRLLPNKNASTQQLDNRNQTTIADTTSTFDYDPSLASVFSTYNPTMAYQTYAGYNNYLQVDQYSPSIISLFLFSPSNRRLFSVIQHLIHHSHGPSQCCPFLLFLLLIPSVSNFVPLPQHTLTRHRHILIPISMLLSDRIYNNQFSNSSHNHRLVKKNKEMERSRRVFRRIYRVNASVVEFLFQKN